MKYNNFWFYVSIALLFLYTLTHNDSFIVAFIVIRISEIEYRLKDMQSVIDTTFVILDKKRD